MKYISLSLCFVRVSVTIAFKLSNYKNRDKNQATIKAFFRNSTKKRSLDDANVLTHAKDFWQRYLLKVNRFTIRLYTQTSSVIYVTGAARNKGKKTAAYPVCQQNFFKFFLFATR